MKVEGDLFDISGEVSYAGQEPWVIGSTIRHNIIFGQYYDGKRFLKDYNNLF